MQSFEALLGFVSQPVSHFVLSIITVHSIGFLDFATASIYSDVVLIQLFLDLS